MEETNLHPAQMALLADVPEDRLTVVQYVGVSETSSVRCKIAPSPSGVLYQDYRMTNYGRHCLGDLIYILKEDANYQQYYKKSRKKIKVPEELQATPKKAPAKKGAKKPGQVTVER